MQSEATQADYAAKPSSYFEQSRTEMLSSIPISVRRVLDVGCGDGSFGALLKQHRDTEVWGIEPFSAAADQAKSKIDKVIHGYFEERLSLPPNYFDCVVFNDVLEHLPDSGAAVRYARTLLSPNGVIVASIPNIRHFPTIWRLVWDGEWKYREFGTLDKTHLKFFTRESIVEMFQEERCSIESIHGINSFCGIPNVSTTVWRLYKVVNLAMGRRFSDMRFERFAVVAKPR